MIYRLTNRSNLRTSLWMSELRNLQWLEIRPPEREGLGIQAGDFVCNLDGEAAARRIQDKFLEIARSDTDRVASDGQMAEFIHKTLDGITFREASDADFWAYLVAIGCPQYLRWRWQGQRADLVNRCVGTIRNNTFAALWWWAQASYDPNKLLDDPLRYRETRIVKGRTSFVQYCVDCAFSGHNPLVRQLCAVHQQNSLDDKESKKLGRSINRMARVVCLDGLQNESEIVNFSNSAYQISQQLR
jgi:hypothetical protein